jgi:5-bromo-4-chloroindolyl phosphate hydrolysis protein
MKRKLERHYHPGYRGPGMRIFFMMQGANPYVCSDIAMKRVGNRVILLDGNWLAAKDTYFTHGQCARAEGKWMRDKLEAAASTLGRASDALIEADARITGMLNTLKDYS